MLSQQITAHKYLASAVLQQAITDAINKKRQAIRFLTSKDYYKEREIWLAWLNMDDKGFQALLKRKIFQGQHNKVFK